MRNFLKCLLLCSLIISGCNEQEESLYIDLDTNTLVFESEGGSQTIAVSSNGAWSVSGETDWCTVSPRTGKKDLTVTVTVSENESAEELKTTLTFSCGTKTATVEVTQEAMLVFETAYMDVDWETSVITGYDENTGIVNILFQGTPPTFVENKAIVFPEDYRCEIRVIKSSTISGNTVTLQTKRGNICNLFMDTNFTLSTDPSLSSLRSTGSGKVITPSEIGIMTEKGYQAIYKKNALRAATDVAFDIFSFHEDYTGTDLYNKGNHRVFWEKCLFDIGLKGVFSFDFGRKIADDEDKLPIGDLKKFEFYLDGNLNIDLLLKYVFEAQIKESKENLIKKNILPLMTVKFMVGTVPVVIFIDTHLYNRYDMEAKAEITMSMGCNIQANAKMGFNYTRGVGVSPILSFTPSFSLYTPTFTAKGSLEAKGSIYPRVEFEIYKCLCPWIEPMPYLREEFGGGMRASTDGSSYLGWTSKSYAGLDCRMGIKMDFGMLIPFVDIWTSDIYTLKDVILFDMPKKIELVSPQNGKKITVGKPVEVSFYASSFNNITDDYFPCIGGLVNFDTQGDVNKRFAVSSTYGLVTVQWTPKSKSDFLTAKIVDKDGETISEVTFTPEYEDGPTEVKVTNITINPSGEVSVEAGQTITLTATVLPFNATNKEIIWSCLNEGIAAVDAQTGVVTGLREGMASIRATAADGSGVVADKQIAVTQNFPSQAQYYVAGDGFAGNPWCNGKSWVADGSPMYGEPASVTFKGVPAGTYSFKVTNGQWSPEGEDWGWDAIAPASIVPGVRNSEGNIQFSISGTANITISFDGTYIRLSSSIGFVPLVISVYTVVGEAGLCGVNWDVSSALGDMSFSGGVCKKVYTNVAAGTYEYKIVGNHSWSAYEYPVGMDNNASVAVGNNNSTVTITFNPATEELNVQVSGSGNEKGVLINDVRWATCNVAAPGTFAASPESAGMFYQWNRRKGWPATGSVTGWDNTIPAGATWEKANDPSPAGWRVPTLTEIQSLCNTDKVNWVWTTQNGVAGTKFTDKTTGNSIFLPAADYRNGSGGTLNYAGSFGIYWSSSASDTGNAYTLIFLSNGGEWNGSNRSYGLSVRAVAE